MIVVLDTNVLVSGLLKPFSSSAAILRLAVSGLIRPAHDFRILTEYREVLNRAVFGFDRRSVEEFLRQIEDEGLAVSPPPLSFRLPDPWDEPFLEVAIGSAAAALITGNKRHFPVKQAGLKISSPSEFIADFRLG
jgi:putative PIN family toxin of toxin-antitoxin system